MVVPPRLTKVALLYIVLRTAPLNNLTSTVTRVRFHKPSSEAEDKYHFHN